MCRVSEDLQLCRTSGLRESPGGVIIKRPLLWAAGNSRLERMVTRNRITSRATHRFDSSHVQLPAVDQRRSWEDRPAIVRKAAELLCAP
jgi:hypothetical protein